MDDFHGSVGRRQCRVVAREVLAEITRISRFVHLGLLRYSEHAPAHQPRDRSDTQTQCDGASHRPLCQCPGMTLSRHPVHHDSAQLDVIYVYPTRRI